MQLRLGRMAAASDRRSTLALIVLSVLAEEPMHPYRMFQLMQERGKTSLVNLTQRNSLYQVIDRLQRSGLIAVDATERDANRPERTVYRITDDGLETAREWLREILRGDKREFPEFPAALSLMALVPPADVASALAERMSRLEAERDEVAQSLEKAEAMQLPRLFVLDEEYRVRMLEAEIEWVRGIISAMDAGELDWSREWIEEIAAKFAQ